MRPLHGYAGLTEGRNARQVVQSVLWLLVRILLDVQLLSSSAGNCTPSDIVSFCSNTAVRTSNLYQTPHLYVRNAYYVRQQTRWQEVSKSTTI
jgi:hypothetical protein